MSPLPFLLQHCLAAHLETMRCRLEGAPRSAGVVITASVDRGIRLAVGQWGETEASAALVGLCLARLVPVRSFLLDVANLVAEDQAPEGGFFELDLGMGELVDARPLIDRAADAASRGRVVAAACVQQHQGGAPALILGPISWLTLGCSRLARDFVKGIPALAAQRLALFRSVMEAAADNRLSVPTEQPPDAPSTH